MRADYVKTLIAICFCGLSIPLSAQTTQRTFTSPDGIFQFKYSDVLIDCTSVGKQEKELVAQSQNPVALRVRSAMAPQVGERR